MFSGVQSAIHRAVFTSIYGSVLLGGSTSQVFPAKSFYSENFNAMANSTILRNVAGWQAYSNTGSVLVERDQWQVQNNKIERMAASEDYDPAPGKFIVGRDAGSPDHIIRAKIVTIPTNGNSIFITVASTTNNNAILFSCQNSSGIMQNLSIVKSVNGTLTTLNTQNGDTSPLGRKLLAGDTVEVQVLGRKVHLFVNTFRITPIAGADIDTGGVFTKGNICGVGTGQGVGLSIDDLYIAPLEASISVTDTNIFWPTDMAKAGRDVPLYGSYAGTVSALDYQVVNSTTNAVVKPWARIPSPTISGGAWLGAAFVPNCSTATNPKIRVQVRAANDTDAIGTSSETAVGICVGSYGQSNSAYRGQGSATSHAVLNAYSWSADAGSSWQGGATTTVSRSQLLATKVAAASGIPCGIFIGGTGSRYITDLNQRGGGQLVLDEMEAICTAANAFGYVASWLWTQGEAEAASAALFNETAYRAEFDILMNELRTGASGGKPVLFGICNIGRYVGVHTAGQVIGDSNWTAARAGLWNLADKPGVYLSNNLNDAVMLDDFHYVSDAYVENGRRAGLSISKALGYGGYDGRGPRITSASRSSAVITLAVNLNGATALAGTGLTNYQVSADNFTTFLTINTAVVSGSNIVLTLSASPATPVKVRSFYGMVWATPTHAIGTYSDGTTIPTEPLYNPLTTN